MMPDQARELLRNEKKFLMRVLKDFSPEHADFAPAAGMMTVSQQIRHIAETMSWFRKGAFEGTFDMDFERLEGRLREPVTIEQALAELEHAYEDYDSFLAGCTPEDLAEPMAPNPVFGELPRLVVFSAQTDHTAHHRGALTVYLRMLGVKPELIYT